MIISDPKSIEILESYNVPAYKATSADSNLVIGCRWVGCHSSTK
jgi:hypothetical protein